MRRRSVTALLALVVLIAATDAAVAATTRVRVAPAAPGRHSTIRVRFTMPVTTGRIGQVRRTLAITLSGPPGPGCVSVGDLPLPDRDAGTAMRVTLTPRRLEGGRWCVGGYTGALVEREQPACSGGPQQVCPQYVLQTRTLARFRFRVTGR